MNKIILKLLLILSMYSESSYAGGKYITPADSPIVAVSVNEVSPWYFGAGVVWAKLSGCGLVKCTYEDVTYGAMVRGGYEFNEYFGIEARGIRTFLDKGPFGGTPLQHVGIYAKPQYPVSEQVNVYGLLGYGYTENLGNGARLNYFDNDYGFSAGIGLEYDLSDREGDLDKNVSYDRVFDGYADQGKNWSLFADYQRLLIKSGVPDMDVISLGLRYDF